MAGKKPITPGLLEKNPKGSAIKIPILLQPTAPIQGSGLLQSPLNK